MKALKLFRSLVTAEAGFSLTEVLVGGGILAGVALAGARMFNDQKMAQKKVGDEQKLMMYHQKLVKEMGVASTCNATLKALYNNAFTAGTTLNGIYKCQSGCVDTNYANGSTTVKNLNRTANDVTPNVTTPIAAVGSYVDSTQTWRLERLAFMQNRSTSGTATIRVTYRINPRLGNKMIDRDIVVNTRFNSAGRFQECLSASESNINNLQNDFCKSLNFDDIDTTGSVVNNGQLARWNPDTQTCEVGTTKNCSDPGMVVDGVDSTGTVRCRPINNSENTANQLQQTGQTSCTSPQKPVMSFENGKIVVKCI